MLVWSAHVAGSRLQVSHHPPISCWWSEGSAGWQYTGEIEVRSKFWGRSVEMMPTGESSAKHHKPKLQAAF